MLGGVGAALAWGVGTLFSTRAARIAGAHATVAWVMIAGLLTLVPWLAGGPAPRLGAAAAGWLLLGGAGNVGGLLVTYRALRGGQIGVVAPIVSAEGGVAALLAVLAGQSIAAAQAIACGVVLVGILLVGGAVGAVRVAGAGHAARLAGVAACMFGSGLYATARASASLPLVWAIAPPRVVGVAVVAVPLLARGGLSVGRGAAACAAVAGLLEVAGFLSYAAGSRVDIAVTAVLASLTGAVAAGVGRVVFGERLARTQLVGVATIVAGVAVLSAVSG